MIKFMGAMICMILLMGCMTSNINIYGTIRESKNGLPIANAVISDGEYGKKNYGISDKNGNYSYITYCEEHTILISAANYKSTKKVLLTPFFHNNKDIQLDVVLEKE